MAASTRRRFRRRFRLMTFTICHRDSVDTLIFSIVMLPTEEHSAQAGDKSEYQSPFCTQVPYAVSLQSGNVVRQPTEEMRQKRQRAQCAQAWQNGRLQHASPSFSSPPVIMSMPALRRPPTTSRVQDTKEN